MKIIIYLFFILTLNTVLFATQDINNLLKSINHDLKEIKEIATTEKSNKHYQPYIVSVLKNDTLTKLGCTTLLDALKLIPNVDISSDNVNYKSLIFRGSNPVSFGQSKLFIDNVLVNNIYFDGYSEYLDMPIELIKRIEVIRGSDSENTNISSYAGSIHVFTYAQDSKDNNLSFAKVGSNNYKSIGFRKSYTYKDIKIFTDVYYKRHDNSVYVKSNGLASGMFNFPYIGIDNTYLSTPADVPLYLRNYSLGLNITYKNINFKSRIYQYKHGTAFGLNYIPSPEENYFKIPNHYAQLQYKKKYDHYLVDFKIGYNYNASDTKAKLTPDVTLPKISNPMEKVVFPNGIYGENSAKQQSVFHSGTLKYFNYPKHDITLGYYLSKTETTGIVSKITNRDTGIGLVDYSNTLPFFDANAHRTTTIFSIKDKYNFSNNLQFLSTLIYENNTHISPIINPKFSLVYNLKNNNILKLLYSKSHRTPSWQELYTINNRARVGNPNLKPEKTENFEASYIKHFSNDNFIQSSLFYIINSNQIHNNTPNNMYVNSTNDNKLYGIEIELKSHFTPKDSLYLNFSYTDGENSPDKSLTLVSKVLAKGYYIYNIKENLSLSTIVTYSSSKDRLLEDEREEIAPQTVTDVAINYKNFHKNININLSVKNIFDTKVVYPSKPNTYQDDYPDVGRTFVLSFSKRF